VVIRKGRVPEASVARLSQYLRCVRRLAEQGRETTSSAEIEQLTGINAAQFRKDLSYFGEFGRPGLGYNVAHLHATLRRIMGLDEAVRAVIVGAGNLGSALLGYPGFREHGFIIEGVFDSNGNKIGREIAGRQVMDIADLSRFVRERHIGVAILTVPAAAAQSVANRLVSAGVKAILNFTPVKIIAPGDVAVRHVDLTQELEVLAYYLPAALPSAAG
jgi:redox-sensing transcriptional repressor